MRKKGYKSMRTHKQQYAQNTQTTMLSQLSSREGENTKLKFSVLDTNGQDKAGS